MLRHRHAIFQRHAVDGDKRNHVGRTHARVRARVRSQVNQLCRLANPANRRFLNGVSFAHQRNHAAVMVGVHLAVKQIDPRNLHGFDNGIDLRSVAAFRKIRYAFNQSVRHEKRIASR